MSFYEHNGIAVEGFVSCKEDFNGVLIILKESNDNSETKNFWFKDENAPGNKGTRTRYKNKFRTLIDCYAKNAQNNDVKNIAYTNIYNGIKTGDTSSASVEYRSISSEDKAKIAIEKIKACGFPEKKITVFTCPDIYAALLEHKNLLETYGKIENGVDEDGVKYQRKNTNDIKLNCFKTEQLDVYEIYHPSYLAKII